VAIRLGRLEILNCPPVDRTIERSSFPQHVQLDGIDLTLNGLGIRKATFMKVNVYVATFYVGQVSGDPKVLIESNDPDELILHFVHSVSADDLGKGWSEGFVQNSKDQLPVLKERIATLNGWMSDVKTGQRLSFIRRPGRASMRTLMERWKGTIAGEDFARAFISIWLGAMPPNPELKSGLLAEDCGQE
jgi:hypothetical protein